MRILLCLLAMASLLNACAYIGFGFIGPKSEGAKFYEIFHKRGDYSGRSVELEKYPLEQQYEIFLYGMQKVHPLTRGWPAPLPSAESRHWATYCEWWRLPTRFWTMSTPWRFLAQWRAGGTTLLFATTLRSWGKSKQTETVFPTRVGMRSIS